MPFVIKEILLAAGSIGLAVLFIMQSFRLPDAAALLPRILAGLIILLAVIMVCRGVVTHWRRVKAGEIEEIPKINVKLVVIYTLAVLAYVFLVEVVGYFVATPIFIVGTYMYLRATSLRNALIIAVGFCVLVYVVFIDMLYLPLPMGLLEDVMGR